jgi:nucleotide-binding universal stress UspA family protein
MPIKTVLSVSMPDQPDDDIRASAQCCAEANAHLTLVLAGIAMPPPVGEYAAELTIEWQELRRVDLRALAEKRQRVQKILEQFEISFDVATEYAEPARLSDAIGLRAHCCDLILLHRSTLSAGDAASALLQGCLFQSARPLLLVPAGARAMLRPANVMIAWDSRSESARAVLAALEIISEARAVHVAIVDPVASSARDGAEPGADIAAYLARHGLNVTVDQLPSGGRPVSDVLKQHAIDVAADLIVMGAYGHSRLRERIFGGVTRSFIEDAGSAVLMVH